MTSLSTKYSTANTNSPMSKLVSVILKAISCMASYVIVSACFGWEMSTLGYFFAAFLTLTVWRVINRYTIEEEEEEHKETSKESSKDSSE